jgi:L-amino acid N-acyltransferase YncA
MQIREATRVDWPLIYPFFREIVAAGESYAFPEGLDRDEAEPWWMETPPGRTVVAVEPDGTVLGSAKMGPNRPGRGAHIATASFMVDPRFAGRGVGRALGLSVLGWAEENGFHAIQFNAVVETNAPAMHLWQSLGFRVLGTVPEAFQHPLFGLVGLNILYIKVGVRPKH